MANDTLHRFYLEPDRLEVALRAVRAVAVADGTIDVREHALMTAAARALRTPGAAELDPASLADITPAQTAAAIADATTRTRIVQAQLVTAMIDGDVDARELAVIRRFASALGVNEPRLENLMQILRHHHTLLKFDLSRHSRMVGDAVKHAYRERGFRGAWSTVLPLLSKRASHDEALAWRYRRLGLLGEDTFGRRYWAHMCEREFAFPGEPGGFPEEFIKHDCCHVLGGYDTDPSGECQVISFICGFMKADPFWYLFMVVVHMHLGIETFVGNPLGRMAAEPTEMLAALRRGSGAVADLYEPGFDWWSLFPLPLAEVRARLGVA